VYGSIKGTRWKIKLKRVVAQHQKFKKKILAAYSSAAID
jgi:hypothetical protein